MLSEKLTRPSRGGRLFLVLMVGLAVAVALSMTFAADTEAKQRCNRPPVYSGETTAWAWGWNGYGQLGDGTSGTDRTTPVQVQNLSAFQTISAGGAHSLALKDDCTVWAWGANYSGQLGDGTAPNNRTTPVQVQNLGKVKAIAAGFGHSLALKTDGTVWAWGWNGYGQVGDGTSGTDRTTPVQVQSLSGVKAIAAGGRHNLALKEDGTVWAWGENFFGQLGDGIFGGDTPNPTPVQVKGEPPTNAPPNSALIGTPVQWNYLSGVTAIAAGFGHSLALKTDGTVRAWGTNWAGQLGDGTNTPRNTPVKVSNLSGITAIAAGDEHNLALKTDGTVRAWGENFFGQLGDGTSGTDRTTPVQVQNLSGVKAIDAGDNHSLAKVSKPPVAQP